MTLLVTEADVRQLLREEGALDEAIALVERALVEQAAGRHVLRERVQLDDLLGPEGGSPERTLRLLPCIVPALGAAAVRIYTTNQVGDPGRPAPAELVLLFDYETMTLRALIEDYSLHTLRTAAPTGIATAYLARPDARRVAVIGAGRHARGQLAAVASARRLSDVRVYSPDAARRAAFCAEAAEALDCPVVACDRPEDAVEGADVVVTATRTTRPVLRAEWLAPGTHVNSIAPFELDEEIILRGRLFPSSAAEAALRRHPIPELLERGVLDSAALETELADVVAGLAPGRESDDEITVFLSNGMANWDVAIAVWAESRARACGLGRELWTPGAGRSLEGLVSPRPSRRGTY